MASISKNFLGLELLRGLSAFSVLIWHYQHFFSQYTPLTESIKQSQPLYALLWPLYEYGEYGVQIFWIISGFIFFWKYKNIISLGGISLKKFTHLRLSRLYPLHIITLVLVALLQYVYNQKFTNYFIYTVNDAYHFILNLGFANAWGFEKGFSFNGPSWTISIEVLVYLIFFLLCKTKLSSKVMFVAFSATLLRFTFTPTLFVSRILDCLVCFLLGGLFYENLYSKRKTNLALIVLILVSTGLEIPRIIGVTLIYISIQSSNDIAKSLRLSQIASHIGNLTYSTYLLHIPIQIILAYLIGQKLTLAQIALRPWFLFVYLSIVYLTSILTFQYIEMPLQKIWRRGRDSNSR